MARYMATMQTVGHGGVGAAAKNENIYSSRRHIRAAAAGELAGRADPYWRCSEKIYAGHDRRRVWTC